MEGKNKKKNVEKMGIDPITSGMRSERSTNELHPQLVGTTALHLGI